MSYTTFEYISPDGELYRSTWDYDDCPVYYGNGSNEFFEDGTNDDKETMLVDCIASSYWEYNSTTFVNYILVCSTTHKWDAGSSSMNRVRLYRFTAAGVLYEDAGTPYVIDNADIEDPDGCELTVVGNTIYAFIWDMDGNQLWGYTWAINPASSTGAILSDAAGIDGYSPMTGVNIGAQALAFVLTDDDPVEWQLILASRAGSKFHWVDQDADDWDEDSTEVELTSGQARDVSIVQYDTDTDYWNVYVAVADRDDHHDDFMEAFHWNGTNYYDESHLVEFDNSGRTTNFPAIIGNDVLRFDDNNSGSVAVLMYDWDDGYGHRIHQVDFGSSTSSGQHYYEWTEDFDCDTFQFGYVNAFVNLSESFAVGKYYVGNPVSHRYYYFISDRDPDLTQSGEGSYDGKNIKVFRNPAS